ncbi:hypothetical protein E5676_scaffold228G00520 [Cucumis melo var. makuwa]|uniref:Uncharacterized protein n=1 Tax=Cucumis melo var. makuwa TaxID=1194695 RepID=A0A5D3D9W8_CUCMM|nr:hypothetical protein E5676_scaffold228G00520 [Cucumis melo var. makuwa]
MIENVILEGFSLKANSSEIDSLNTVLSEIEGNIFFGFTADGEAQGDFLARRQILDHDLIAKEAIYRRRKKEDGVLKFDFEKAHDPC